MAPPRHFDPQPGEYGTIHELPVKGKADLEPPRAARAAASGPVPGFLYSFATTSPDAIDAILDWTE
jgi:hypothetical protein